MPHCPLCLGAEALAGRGVGNSLLRCGSCGTLYQERPPLPGEIPNLYGEDYYDSWGLAQEPLAVEEMKRRTSQDFLSRLEMHVQPGRLLELGCATGFLMAEARERGWDAHGVEINPAAATAAARRFPGRVHSGTLESAPFAPPFQAACLIDVFEHLFDPLSVLRLLGDLLAPGGVLLLVVPDANSISRRLMRGMWPHIKKEHLFYPTVDGIRRAGESAGLSQIGAFPARKTLSFDYLARQFIRYPRPVLTPAARALLSVAPASLRRACIRIPMGQTGVFLAKGGKP